MESLRAADRSSVDPHVQAAVRQRGTALHHQIAVVLGDRIRSGVYQPGEAIPGEPELCRQFQVSRITIRTALATLERLSLVERRQGIGTFASQPKPTTVLRSSMSDILAHIEAVSSSTKVDLLEFGHERPPNHVRAFFGVEPEASLMRALRLRRLRRKPIFLVENYVPDWISSNVVQADFKGPSFYKSLQSLGISFASGDQTISAVLASPKVAGFLGTEVGAALLQVRRYYRDETGRAVQFIEFLSSPSVYEIHMRLDGSEPAA